MSTNFMQTSRLVHEVIVVVVVAVAVTVECYCILINIIVGTPEDVPPLSRLTVA